MTDSVSVFCRRYAVLLPQKTASDFRLLRAGVYSHKTLPFGTSREGITNGVVAYVAFDCGVQHVHLANLDATFDARPARANLAKPCKARVPRTSKRASMLLELLGLA